MTVVNTASNTIVSYTPIAGGLTGVAAAPNGSVVYITAQSSNQVEVVSTASNTVTATIPVGATPVAVAFHPNSLTAYVVNEAANTVSVINTASNSVVATIPVQSRPVAIAVNPSGTRAIVANNWSSTLSVIDTGSNSVVANIAVGNGISGVAITPNGLYAYATNQISNSVAVVNLASNTLVQSIPVQSYPNSIAISPNGGRAFVTNGNSGSVSVIDVASNTVIATLGVGVLPSAIAISPDGTRAQVANSQGYSTSVLDTNNLAVIGSVDRIGIFPVGVAFAPAGNSGGGGGGGSPIPCNYTLTNNSLDFTYIGGNGSTTVNVATGATNCNWTASSNASWITIVSGIAGSGSGVTSFIVAANPSSTARSGSFTMAGLAFTINQGPAPAAVQAPTADAINPSSGTGASQKFLTTYSDPAGFTNLTNANLLFGASTSNSNSCLVSYFRPNNQIYLLNDAGSVYLGPIAMGSTATLSNSQCTVDGGASSASGSGSSLTVSVAIAFTSGFAGAKTSYALATNGSGLSSGWQARGIWTVPGNSGISPVLYTITPALDSGSGRIFYSAYSDPNGASNIQWTELLFGSALQGANSCWVIYNRPTNTLFLYNDNYGFYGPVTPGVPGSLQNGQCILDAGTSYAATSGNLLVNVSLSFKGSFTGPKNAYMVSINNAGKDTGWQAVGSYNVQ